MQEIGVSQKLEKVGNPKKSTKLKKLGKRN